MPDERYGLKLMYQSLLSRLTKRLHVNVSLQTGWKENAAELRGISPVDYNMLNFCQLLPEARTIGESVNLAQQARKARAWVLHNLFWVCFSDQKESVERIYRVVDPKKLESILEKVVDDISIYYNRQRQVKAIFGSLKDRIRDLTRTYPALGQVCNSTIITPSDYLEMEEGCNFLTIDRHISEKQKKDESVLKSPMRLAAGTIDSILNEALAHLVAAGEERTLFELPYHGLTELPREIQLFTKLTKIDLGHNRLESLPEAIGECVQVQDLLLDNNCLRTLPESIGKLRQIQRLVLTSNNMQTLPASIGQLAALNILWIDLQRSQDIIFPKEIGSLRNLSEIRVDNAVSMLKQITEFSLQDSTILTNLKMLIDSLNKALSEQMRPYEIAPDQGVGVLMDEEVRESGTKLGVPESVTKTESSASAKKASSEGVTKAGMSESATKTAIYESAVKVSSEAVTKTVIGDEIALLAKGLAPLTNPDYAYFFSAFEMNPTAYQQSMVKIGNAASAGSVLPSGKKDHT